MRFFIVSNTATSALHSCIRSLSDEQMTTRIPSFTANPATVAITSSASKPGTHRVWMPNASTTRWTSSTCTANSGGIGGRCALYSVCS